MPDKVTVPAVVFVNAPEPPRIALTVPLCSAYAEPDRMPVLPVILPLISVTVPNVSLNVPVS